MTTDFWPKGVKFRRFKRPLVRDPQIRNTSFSNRKVKSFKLGALIVAVLAAFVGVAVFGPWEYILGPSYPRFQHAAIASNGPECAKIGRNILERGGSAVDAAIASLLCEGVSCAQCNGIGGGFIATLYDRRSGRVRVLNARERAPAGTTRNMFAQASSAVGGLAVAIPGELRGYGELHRQYGRLPWRDLVTPTKELCRHGHQINGYLASTLASHSDTIKADPSMRDAYVNPATGEVYKLGDTLILPKLAETMETIAEEGPEALHNGSLTAGFVKDIRDIGGIITENDMRNFRLEWQEPIQMQLDHENTLYTAPLPASGALLVFMLNMQLGWVGDSRAPLNSELYWHRVIETFKHAFAKRTALGDPSRTDLLYSLSERNLSNPTWAAMHRSKVDDTRTFNNWQHYGAMFGNTEDHGTAHSLVIAPDGSAVSITSTINYEWGCKRISRSTGIILNNEMDDFAIPGTTSGYGCPPSPANMLAPGLNPLSSMVPTIVLNNAGDAVLAVGAAGGTKITTQVIRHRMLEKNDLPYAMSRPRLHHQLVPNEIVIEEGFDEGILESLRRKGHDVPPLNPAGGFAATVAAARDSDGYLVPVSDRRRPGSVDGF